MSLPKQDLHDRNIGDETSKCSNLREIVLTVGRSIGASCSKSDQDQNDIWLRRLRAGDTMAGRQNQTKLFDFLFVCEMKKKCDTNRFVKFSFLHCRPREGKGIGVGE